MYAKVLKNENSITRKQFDDFGHEFRLNSSKSFGFYGISKILKNIRFMRLLSFLISTI